MPDAYTLWPGSDAALTAGCICPVMDNARGDIEHARARGGWWMVSDCPVHSSVKPPILASAAGRSLMSALSDAVLSPCGTYRYMLSREWLTGDGTCLFVMLNPSTADAEQDDPTIRRCVGFAQHWGFRRLTVANLYAYRATNPDELTTPSTTDPIGPDCNYWIARLADEADFCVAAWGARPPAVARAPEVLHLLADRIAVHALKLSRERQPRHPLYVRADTRPSVIQPLRSFALPIDALDTR